MKLYKTQVSVPMCACARCMHQHFSLSRKKKSCMRPWLVQTPGRPAFSCLLCTWLYLKWSNAGGGRSPWTRQAAQSLSFSLCPQKKQMSLPTHVEIGVLPASTVQPSPLSKHPTSSSLPITEPLWEASREDSQPSETGMRHVIITVILVYNVGNTKSRPQTPLQLCPTLLLSSYEEGLGTRLRLSNTQFTVAFRIKTL